MKDTRILVCVDESMESRQAILAVASQTWTKGTEVRLLTVVNPDDYSLVPMLERKIGQIRLLHQRLANELEETPVFCSSFIREGEPVATIISEVGEWQPTVLFIGARRKGWLRRLMTASVSAEVIVRVRCSVEQIGSQRSSAAPRGWLAGLTARLLK